MCVSRHDVRCFLYVAAVSLALVLVAGTGCKSTLPPYHQESREGSTDGEAPEEIPDAQEADAHGDAEEALEPEIEIDPRTGIEWVTILGGTYIMQYSRERLAHEVTVPTFQIARTEVTIAQYDKCVEAGACEPLPTQGRCSYDFREESRESYPINCVTWQQARDFCEWIGARLPSEAEWEFAMRNRGQVVRFPWGDEDISCDYAVYNDLPYCPDDGCAGCRTSTIWAVCSKPKGNTVQGLCDMIGNLEEWVEDDYHSRFEGAPKDGSAWVDEPRSTWRMTRGGSFLDEGAYEGVDLSLARGPVLYGREWHSIGIRPARSLP